MKKYLIFFLFLSSTLFSSTNPHFHIIYRHSPGAGFWSNFFVMLAGIHEADKKNLIPVVDMERYPTHYNEEIEFFGLGNAWEYYFEQPGRVSLTEALQGNFTDNQGRGVFSHPVSIQPPKDKIIRAKELINKYIKVKNYIIDEANSIISPGLHFNIVGIHVRGTDRRKGAPKHLLTANDEVYLQKARELDLHHNFLHIFLACDEIETVDLFKKEFGKRLIVTDAYRVSQNTKIRGGYDWLFKANRPFHRYLLGKEVLIDVLLLARCGHLICGPSNVSHAAIYFSESPQYIHEIASPGFYSPK